MQTKNLKMLSPWESLVNQFRALFAKDPAVKVAFCEDDMEIRLYVEGQRKADALTKLLPTKKILGNVCVKITVVPANTAEKSPTLAELFEDAFDGNDAFTETFVADVFASNPITYVMFEPEVVQYWNDNLGDPHGNIATLYQDIAREVFSGGIGGNASFSTDLPVPE